MSKALGLSIIASSFRENITGKKLSGTKTISEFNFLVNNHEAISIEVSNSRLSRKKVIKLNGETVEKFHKTRTKDLVYTWTHKVDGMDIDLQVSPNATKTGTDLMINGADFFDYVRGVDPEGPDPLRPYHGSFNSFMKFTIPPRTVEKSSRRIEADSYSHLKNYLPVKKPSEDEKNGQGIRLKTDDSLYSKHTANGGDAVSLYPNIDDDSDKKLLGNREDLIQL